MTLTRFDIPYDPDRWVHVPLDYEGTPWTGPDEWADWLAQTATEGRPDAEVLRAAVRAEAFATAIFPAPHVSSRFWHYPSDGAPSGFADLFVQARDDDGAPPETLLPEIGFTFVDPVVEPASSSVCRAAVRRLTLNATLVDDREEPVLVPKAEWLGVTPDWVIYLASADYDADALTARLDDLGALFAGVDPG